jgi:hypothetical protein
MKKTKQHQWQAPNKYIQFLHDNALISLELFYILFANHKQADFEAFWSKTDCFIAWLN